MHGITALFWFAWFLIFYTYVLFPLLLALFARLFGKKEAPSTPDTAASLPRVAMVVAAFNEGKVLPAKLVNTWKLDYPTDKFQLIIGSDGSEDHTGKVLTQCQDSRLKAYLFTERRGKISVLNDLMNWVDADIVIMSDANTMFAPDAIQKLVAPFQDAKVGCVSGELGLEQEGGVSGEGLYWKYEGWIKRCESRLGFLIGCNGGIYALRPELYRPLPSNTIVDDFVLTLCVLEQGYQVGFVPEAKATEPPCPSSKAEMVRKIRIGAGGFQALALTWRLLMPQYGFRAFAYWGHKVLRWCVPLFLLVALLANIPLAMASGFYQGLLVLQLVGAMVAAWSYRARPEKALPRWTRPISYFYLMNYALFCGLLRFLGGKQRVTWDRLSR